MRPARVAGPHGPRSLAVAVLLGALGVVDASPAGAKFGATGVARPAAQEIRRTFPGVHLLGLAEDQLLFWEVHGRAQLRASDGTWMAELRLPLAGILDVQPDGSGFLVAGTLPGGGAAVVSMSAVVQERRRWPIPGAGAYAVFTDDAGQHALTRRHLDRAWATAGLPRSGDLVTVLGNGKGPGPRAIRGAPPRSPARIPKPS